MNGSQYVPLFGDGQTNGEKECRADFFHPPWQQSGSEMQLRCSLMQEASLNMIREQNVACEKLTERQLAEVVTQAILCGDIIRNVRVGSPHAQSVVYVPYAESERLRSEIHRLKEFIKERGLEEIYNCEFNCE